MTSLTIERIGIGLGGMLLGFITLGNVGRALDERRAHAALTTIPLPPPPNPPLSASIDSRPQELTLRDYFAAQAINIHPRVFNATPEDVASQAYAIADAMLAERNRK